MIESPQQSTDQAENTSTLREPLEITDNGKQNSLPRLKICHVVATTEGATWMFEQLRELRARYGYEVSAIVSGNEGKLVELLRGENIPFFVAEFAFSSLRKLLRLPFTIIRMALLFRQQRFDVVQTHIFHTMLIGRIAAWLADVPVRLSMIAGPFHLEAHTSRWIDRSTQWMETALIPSCVKSEMLCREIGVGAERLSLIYYSVDEEKFDPLNVRPATLREDFNLPDDAPLIGKIAYFYPRLPIGRWIPNYLHEQSVKGHDDLINAVQPVLAKFPDAKFILVGSGWGEAGEQYLSEVKQKVRALGLDSSVIFAGYRQDINQILRSLDVAVQASLNENLGGTLEALMMECPLVATRVGGMVDSVIDGQTGILVNPGDPHDLARGILEMLEDRERARILGRNGRRLALEKFSLTRTVADLSALYTRLWGQIAPRRKYYSRFVFFYRLLMLFPVCLYIGFRLFILDTFLPHYLPAYKSRLLALVLKLYYHIRYYFLVLPYLLLKAGYALLLLPRRRKKDLS